MSEELDNGNISAVPTGNDDSNPCEWCAYKAICGHGDKDEMNVKKNFKTSEVVEMLEKEQGKEEEE